jgi:hypothetical protein
MAHGALTPHSGTQLERAGPNITPEGKSSEASQPLQERLRVGVPCGGGPRTTA